MSAAERDPRRKGAPPALRRLERRAPPQTRTRRRHAPRAPRRQWAASITHTVVVRSRGCAGARTRLACICSRPVKAGQTATQGRLSLLEQRRLRASCHPKLLEAAYLVWAAALLMLSTQHGRRASAAGDAAVCAACAALGRCAPQTPLCTRAAKPGASWRTPPKPAAHPSCPATLMQRRAWTDSSRGPTGAPLATSAGATRL